MNQIGDLKQEVWGVLWRLFGQFRGVEQQEGFIKHQKKAR